MDDTYRAQTAQQVKKRQNLFTRLEKPVNKCEMMRKHLILITVS